MNHNKDKRAHYSVDSIPAALKAFDLWAPYCLVKNPGRDKFDKIPKTLNGRGLSSSDPTRWYTFDNTLTALNRNDAFAGPGFCMTGAKGKLIAIDLDNCVGADWALDLIRDLASYTELSPSGNGYRIFLRGALPDDWTNHERGIEVYGGNAGRFVTVTGWHVEGTPDDIRLADPLVMYDIESQYRKAKAATAEVIDLTLPDLIDEQDLPTLEDLPIHGDAKRFLLEGEFDTDRSGTLFACGVALYAAGYSDAQVLSLLHYNPYAWEVALDHRRQDGDRALMYLWREHCIKARAKGSKAVASVDEFDIVQAAEGDKPLPKFSRDKNGRIDATIVNLNNALLRPDYCGMQIAYDQFRDEILFTPDDQPNAWRPFRDCDYVELRLLLENRGFRPIGRELIRDVVMKVADDNVFDTAQVWLDGLVWDGVPRIERFLPTYFGADDTPYARAVSLYLWTAMAGRVVEPGVKADMVPILVGAQGLMKSSAIAAMVPGHEFFTEISFHEKDEDLARKMRGRLIAEIGELRGLHTRELEGIKAFITRTHENWVPKYREFAVQFPRRLIFIGTTNQDQFLADDTGNRRWLPVRVEQANIEAVRRDRLQCWAEARVLFDLLGIAFQAAEKLGADVHDEFTLPERWFNEISDWLDAPDALTDETPRTRQYLRVHDIARECLRMEPTRLERKDETQISKVLRMLGYERKKVRVSERVLWCFVPVRTCMA